MLNKIYKVILVMFSLKYRFNKKLTNQINKKKKKMAYYIQNKQKLLRFC